MMSGVTPSPVAAVFSPIRPNAVCASSKMSIMPRFEASSLSVLKYPSGGMITPPADRMGSATIAAPAPSDDMSNSLSPTFMQLISHVSRQCPMGQR